MRIFARNPYNTEFAGRIAFFDADETTRTISGDRTEFVGRNGTLRSPAAMTRCGCLAKWGPGSIPAAQSTFHSSWSTGKSVRSSSGSASGEMPKMPGTWFAAFGDLPRRA